MINHRIHYILLVSALLTGLTGYAWAEDANLLLTLSDHYKHVLVERVLSADEIMLEGGEHIQLIGLKAPEPPPRAREEQRDKYGFVIHEENPQMTIEERAFQFAKNLLQGKYVRLEFDEVKKSESFTTVAYVFLEDNNQLANAEILRQGYASLHIVPPNLKYVDILREAYQESRREKRGLQSE